MTTPLKTGYTDYVTEMAGITPPETSYSAATTAQETVPTTTQAQTSQSSQQPTAGASTQQPASQTSTQAPEADSSGAYKINLREYGGNLDTQNQYYNLFKPINQTLSGASKALSGATTDFLSGAGNRRTYGGLGGDLFLEDVLAGKQDESKAKDMAKASYKGPTGLSQSYLDSSAGDVMNLQARAGSFLDQSGIRDLISQQSPGLSQGELAFEARTKNQDPNFRQARTATNSDITNFLKDYQRAQSEASAIAQQRAADESEIAKNTQSYLTGKKSAIMDPINAQLTEENKRNQQFQDAYNKFYQSGSIDDLNALGALGGQDLSGFNSQNRQKYDEAQRVYNQVMNDPKYAAIKDVPQMMLSFNKEGRETLTFNPDWWKEHEKDHTKAEWAQIKALARQRAKELESSGFGGQYWKDRYTAQVSDPEAPGKPQVGDLGLYKPFYYEHFLDDIGGAWKPQDYQNYVHLDIRSPSRENLTPQEQEDTVNKIDRILSMAEDYNTSDPEEAYKAATVMSELDRYLKEEEAALSKQSDFLKEKQNWWRDRVRHMRKQYEKENSSNFWSDVLGAVTAGSGTLLPGVGTIPGLEAFDKLDVVGQSLGGSEAGQKALKAKERI